MNVASLRQDLYELAVELRQLACTSQWRQQGSHQGVRAGRNR
jgi:hypothetical protein